LREDLKETLIDSMTDVLEKLTFIFIEEAEDEEMDVSGRELLSVSMDFTGEKEGHLSLLSPKDKVVEISANILGLEEDEVTRDMYADSFGEVLNVLCGNILTAEYGVDPVFDLSVPTVNDASEEQWKQLMGQEHALSLLMDEDPCIITFEVK